MMRRDLAQGERRRYRLRRHGDAEVIKHLQRFATVLFWFGSSVGVLLVFKVESEKFWEFEEGVTALHHTVLRMAGEKVVEPNAINAAQTVLTGASRTAHKIADTALSASNHMGAQLMKARRSTKAIV